MSALAPVLLSLAFSGTPDCERGQPFGDLLPVACVSREPVTIETPRFQMMVDSALRYGVCETGDCVWIKGINDFPIFGVSVHHQPLQGRLAGIESAEQLSDALEGPMRPCEVTQVGERHWVHCRHDFGEHVAADRLEEGDYYHLDGDHWLGVRYTLARGDNLANDRARFQRMLKSLAPANHQSEPGSGTASDHRSDHGSN